MKNNTMEKYISKHPKTPNLFWRILMYILSPIFNGPFGTRSKIIKHNVKSFKEPALVLANHGSFVDFANMTVAMRPHLPCYIAAIDEFVGRAWLMRQIGCFPKRKFTTDLSLIKKINAVINKDKKSVAIYPEARFSIAGVTEDIGDTLGKMVKLCKCRVIVMNQKGNFLNSPQWNKHPYRKVKNICDIYEVVSKEEAISLPAEEIQRRIEEAFVYDEYKWQFENKIRIKCKKRAHNIHQILYKCPDCNSEGHMKSNGIHLWCEKCNAKWEMDEYGQMIQEGKQARFPLVSDWYRWEKQETINEVNNGTYYFEDEVRLENLDKKTLKFKEIGTVKLIHNMDGYILDGTLNDGSHFHLEKPCLSTRSMHIEYNYKKRGNALDFATIDDTWFAFPKTKGAILTKFNFSTEALFFKHKTK